MTRFLRRPTSRLPFSALVFCASVFLAGLLSACQPTGPVRSISRGEELANYDFARAGTFEEGAYGNATLRVRDGEYEIAVNQGDNALWWGQWGDTYSDVVIDVDVEQQSERPEASYGVMCRVRGAVGQPQTPDPELAAIMAGDEVTSEATSEAIADATSDATIDAGTDNGVSEDDPSATPELATTDELAPDLTSEAETPEQTATDALAPDSTLEAGTQEADSGEPSSYGEGDGYLFLLQGTGQYGIFRARGRSLQALVDWTESDRILPPPQRNHLRAVCAGSYLALYINDQFVADTSDDAYASGQVGLAASAANPIGVRAHFDNLSIAAVGG